jgi:hypothetical protein
MIDMRDDTEVPDPLIVHSPRSIDKAMAFFNSERLLAKQVRQRLTFCPWSRSASLSAARLDIYLWRF